MAFLDSLQTIDTRLLLGNSRLYTGSNIPDNPVAGDIWTDGNYLWGCCFSRIGGSNVWATEMKVASASFDGIWSTSSPTFLRALIPIADNSSGMPLQVIVRRVTLAYCMGTTAHNGTNRYNFLGWWRNSTTGAASALNVSSTQVNHSSGSAVANRSYHLTWNVNSVVGGAGTLGCLQMDAERIGTPGGLSGVAFTAYYQLIRP